MRKYFTPNDKATFEAYCARNGVNYVGVANCYASEADLSGYHGVLQYGVKAETKAKLDKLLAGESISPQDAAPAKRDDAFDYVVFSSLEAAQRFVIQNGENAVHIGKAAKYRKPARSGIQGVNPNIVVSEGIRSELDDLLS